MRNLQGMEADGEALGVPSALVSRAAGRSI